MALLDQTRSAHTGFGFGVVSKLIGSISAWNDARQTRKALYQLSDRELADIGLERGEIDRLTF